LIVRQTHFASFVKQKPSSSKRYQRTNFVHTSASSTQFAVLCRIESAWRIQMGRKKLNKQRLEVKIEAPLLQEVKRRVTMKYNDRPQSGALSSLVEVLLRKWVETEVQVDPMRPVNVNLDNFIEEYDDGKVSSDSPDSNGPQGEASGGEVS